MISGIHKGFGIKFKASQNPGNYVAPVYWNSGTEEPEALEGSIEEQDQVAEILEGHIQTLKREKKAIESRYKVGHNGTERYVGNALISLWFRTTKNSDGSTGPLARPFVRSLKLLTRSLAPPCFARALCCTLSFPGSLTYSRVRGTSGCSEP